MKKIILSIKGMTCSACSNGLEKYLNKQDKIIEATVNLVMASASITYEDSLEVKEIEKYIKDAGFKSLGPVNIEKKDKTNIKPFIIYGLLAIILMYISMASMINLPIFPLLNMNLYPKIYSLTLLFLTIPFIFFGFDIIKSGIKNLFHKMPNMDTLVSIGVISSFIYSIFNVIMVILGHNNYIHYLYFESTAFVILFIKLGRLIDSNNKLKTRDAIKKLVVMTPKEAKLKTKEEIKIVTIDEIKKDDILICNPGEKIAVDGIITSGKTHLDEAFITGESSPVEKKINDKVIAGSINYEGNIEYKAVKIGKDSTISEIVNLVIEATNTKAPIALLADKISSYFVPIILVISIITLFVNLSLGISLAISIKRFVTVLVVSCPCALGLATPLSIIVSEGVCAKKGILVKTSKVFEIANKIDTIVFDKTGILTNGKLNISKFYNLSKYNDNEVLNTIYNIEKNSNHPIGIGIVNSIKNNFKIKFKDENFKIENLPGYGIKATYNKNIYFLGNSKIIKMIKIKNTYEDKENELKKQGNSIVYLIKNEEIIALLGVKDTIRNNIKEVVKNLKEKNIDVVMLTGDNKETANIIAKELEIDKIIANVIPKEKQEYIKSMKENNKKVIMVGDGINDAPSLTLADIGISISDGTDIATDAADVILLRNDISNIIDLLNISKKTLNNIKGNLFWAFFYNIIMIPIATGIFSKQNININPMIACTAMIMSSLFVTFNALRLKKDDKNENI